MFEVPFRLASAVTHREGLGMAIPVSPGIDVRPTTSLFRPLRLGHHNALTGIPGVQAGHAPRLDPCDWSLLRGAIRATQSG